jgi:gluconokinase
VIAPLVVIMGVTGSGKSLIGSALAQSLGVKFVDGDDFHSAENIEKMSSGVPLTDGDRAEWLAALAREIHAARAADRGIVVACSALKRRYRDILRAGARDLNFILLNGTPKLIAERLAHRGGHFMPPSLLNSQLAALEKPAADEQALVYDIANAPEQIVADIVARIAS